MLHKIDMEPESGIPKGLLIKAGDDSQERNGKFLIILWHLADIISIFEKMLSTRWGLFNVPEMAP